MARSEEAAGKQMREQNPLKVHHCELRCQAGGSCRCGHLLESRSQVPRCHPPTVLEGAGTRDSGEIVVFMAVLRRGGVYAGAIRGGETWHSLQL